MTMMHPKVLAGAKRGRGTDKTPVVGMIDRNNKKAYIKVALPNGEGQAWYSYE